MSFWAYWAPLDGGDRCAAPQPPGRETSACAKIPCAPEPRNAKNPLLSQQPLFTKLPPPKTNTEADNVVFLTTVVCFLWARVSVWGSANPELQPVEPLQGSVSSEFLLRPMVYGFGGLRA